MKKIDSTIIKETVYIFAFTLIFSVLMQAVFLIIGKWNYTVLLGNLLGGLAAVGNFFLMGLTVQSALGKEEKDAKSTMKLSQMLRTLMLFIVAVIGHVAGFPDNGVAGKLGNCFYCYSLLLSLDHPRSERKSRA